MMKVLIVNGPNLNMVGKREESIYGRESFEKIIPWLKEQFPTLEIDYFQSNIEGELVDKVQRAGELGYKGLIINPGAYAHYSIAIHDALLIPALAKIEVHLSNVHAREEMRQPMITAKACDGVITGLGKEGYRLAIEFLVANAPGKVGFRS
jgi:3-dehydroquinate dehydratase II